MLKWKWVIIALPGSAFHLPGEAPNPCRFASHLATEETKNGLFKHHHGLNYLIICMLSDLHKSRKRPPVGIWPEPPPPAPSHSQLPPPLPTTTPQHTLEKRSQNLASFKLLKVRVMWTLESLDLLFQGHSIWKKNKPKDCIPLGCISQVTLQLPNKQRSWFPPCSFSWKTCFPKQVGRMLLSGCLFHPHSETKSKFSGFEYIRKRWLFHHFVNNLKY